jgi:hypothetical protein
MFILQRHLKINCFSNTYIGKMIGQIGINCRILERFACIVGAVLLTLNVFPPNDPPPMFLPFFDRPNED